MAEMLIALFVLFLVLGLLVVALGLPLFILFRTTRQIAELKARIDRVERELSLRVAGEAKPQPVTAVQPGEPGIVEVLPADAAPALRRIPRLMPIAGSLDLEAWIGRRGLGWAAVVLLLFATAFFLKYAFENEWVGELGRVMIGVLAGVGLCLGGVGYHRRGWRLFSQMLTAAGVALLYLATFGAFGYYHLLPNDRAALFLVILIAEAAALAVLYEAPAIALMAIIGGLLNPLLLRTEHDQYRSLFVYLTMLNLGVVGLALFHGLAGRQPFFLFGHHVADCFVSGWPVWPIKQAVQPPRFEDPIDPEHDDVVDRVDEREFL